jgi:hypothetical protein
MDRKNKKGQGLVELFSWLMMLMFTIIFFILFSIPGCDGDIPDQKLDDEDLAVLQDEFNLISFLRTPVEVEGAEISMAELVILRKENRDEYRSIYEQKAAETIIDLRMGCSSVIAGGVSMRFGEGCEDVDVLNCGNATQVIPYHEGNFTVRLCARDWSFWRGWFWQTKEPSEFGIQPTG